MGKCFSKEKKIKKKRTFDVESEFEKRREQLNKHESELSRNRATFERELTTFRVEKANLKSQQDAAITRTNLANEKLTALEATKTSLQKAKEALESQQKDIQAKHTALLQFDTEVTSRMQQLRDFYATNARIEQSNSKLSINSLDDDEFSGLISYHPPGTPISDKKRSSIRLARNDSVQGTISYDTLPKTSDIGSPLMRKVNSPGEIQTSDAAVTLMPIIAVKYESPIDALASAARNKHNNDSAFAVICIENICSKSFIESKDIIVRHLEVCLYITELLNHYSDGEHIIICEKVLAAIAYLSSLPSMSRQYIAGFNDCNTLVAIQNCIRKHIEFPDVIILGCESLLKLLVNSAIIELSGANGGCELVVTILCKYRSTGTVMEAVLKVFFNLSGHHANRILFADTDYLVVLAECGKRYADNLAISRSICSIVATLAQEDSNRDLLTSAGIDELLLDLTKRHKQHVDHAQLGCLAISKLVTANMKNSSKLGDLGVCELVVSLMHRHKDSALVMEAACLAVMNLSTFDKNNEKLEYAGVCEVIMAAFAFDESTSTAALMAMINLAVRQRNRERLGDAGACSVIINLLKIEQMEPTRQWCMLINNLCANCIDNKIRLGDEGACSLLIQIIRTWFNTEVIIRQAVSAIKNLAAVEENCEKFMDNDVCNILARVLQEYSSNAGIVDKISISIEFLAQMQDNATARDRIKTANMADLLVRALAMHPNNESLLEHINATLGVLDDDDENENE